MSDYQEMVEFRCRRHNCNKLLLNYYITGVDSSLHLEGIELKCEKCKRVLRLKNYTEKLLAEQSEKGVFRV